MGSYDASAWAGERFAHNYLERADIYIQERRKLFRIAVSHIVHCYGKGGHLALLDIGSGDGVLAEIILKAMPGSRATLIDGSAAMVAKARERLRDHDGTRFLVGQFQEVLAGEVPLERYDWAVSSMAIHHLEQKEKAALYRLVASHLNSGGGFLNIDVVLPPSQELEVWYLDLWRGWLGEMMERHGVNDESPDDLIARYKDPASMNKPGTLESQLEALREAGCVDVDCYYKNGIFAVFGGRVP